METKVAHSRPKVLAGATLASLAVTLPIALAGAPQASADALVSLRARSGVVDALRSPVLLASRAGDGSSEDARLAVDDSDETVWAGRPGDAPWTWTAVFAAPVHLGLVRAHFGTTPTSGVPTSLRWQVRPPSRGGRRVCAREPRYSGSGDDGWVTLDGTEQKASDAGGSNAQATRRSWFVDADACALRLVVDQTNAGPPVVRQVQAIQSAVDVLRQARASDDGTYPGFSPRDAIDGTYVGRWAGAPNRPRWTLRVDLPSPQRIDRVRLVLGFDATSVPRPGHGRTYAIQWGPLHYVLEASEDGRHFTPIATEPLRADGAVLPIRRRLVTLAEPRTVRALRLVMTGATGARGVPDPGAVPVVREIAAYRADDKRPILASPWLLSINANPSGFAHLQPGGEVWNDAYWAQFLQKSFAPLLPELRRDDRFARPLDVRGRLISGTPDPRAGEVLEAIEGDDPLLDARFLTASSPPPIGVLSGSDDWDYDSESGPDRVHPKRWHWDPLRDARAGGIGQLAAAVRNRVAPFMGFCGGAQILGLLEAKRDDGAESSTEQDRRIIDRVLKRTSGHRIRGFAPPIDLERAWPGDPHPPRAKISFLPGDPLFADLAGPLRRSTTQALPESHTDALRSDAFLPGGPLQRFEILATSSFCAPDVVAAGPHDGVFPNPAGGGWCDTVPEAYRSRDAAWPVIATQFHAEQRDFTKPGPGDPPESVADPRLFLAAAFEQMVDAYVKLAP